MKLRLFNVYPLILSFGILFTTGCSNAEEDSSITYQIPEQPEMATGYTEKPGWATTEFAVAAANPLATDAGYQIIKAGGSAVDAAIAVQLVLTLVEPQSSGIGGGAFLMFWDGNEISSYDGREIAPAAANENMFLDENGDVIPFNEARYSGKSSGVPGTLAMLHAAHQKHGNLEWSELFEPAITLADQGFEISPRLHSMIDGNESLRGNELAADYYFDDEGESYPVGHNLKNPALAEILKNVAEQGVSGFYRGDVPQDIVERLKNHERPGVMEITDIEGYPAQDFERMAMCNDWKIYRICGFPPPASGHISIMQMLGIMEYLDAPETSFENGEITAEWLHQYMEAAKLAFADRNQYVGDSLFVEAPGGSWQSLLEDDYLQARATLVGEQSMGEADPGIPGEMQTTFGVQPQQPEYGTSHISIVDMEGNAVSMTTTIESAFGNHIMSDGGTGQPGGFHMNNELTDFSLSPIDENGNPIANRVEPGKRPRSSMGPTLIFERDTGELVASVGSPGGTAIIHYTAKAIVGMLDWGLNAQQAINLPNFGNYNSPAVVLEEGRFPGELIEALEAMGHEVVERSLTSGLQAIQKTDEGYYGGADPRREGVVMGD